jgi:hypothetical protein
MGNNDSRTSCILLNFWKEEFIMVKTEHIEEWKKLWIAKILI